MKDDGGVDGRRHVRWGLRLVLITAGYNALEASVAVWAAVAAGSVALLAFGLDSVIELAAGAAMAWHLRVRLATRARETDSVQERRTRQFIGATLAALAAYVTVEALRDLAASRTPEASPVGIALAALSLIVMPALARAKANAAARIESRALHAEAMESVACALLAFTLLLGLVADAVLGWGWADAAAALLMVPWLLREAWEAWQNEA